MGQYKKMKRDTTKQTAQKNESNIKTVQIVATPVPMGSNASTATPPASGSSAPAEQTLKLSTSLPAPPIPMQRSFKITQTPSVSSSAPNIFGGNLKLPVIENKKNSKEIRW